MLFLILLLVHRATNAQIPATPCPQIFAYFESPSLGIFGAVTFPNDLSGVYDLQINMTVPITTKDNIEIRRQSSDLEVQSGRPLKYFVVFPKSGIVPKLVSVTFNNQLYCYGPASEGPVVTTLSRRNVLRTGGHPQSFQQPQNVDAKPQSFGMKPQNFQSKPQIFPENFELEPQSKPQNFEPQNFGPQIANSFDSKPQNFPAKPQNFDSGQQIKPPNFEPQSFRPQSTNSFNSNPQRFPEKPQDFDSGAQVEPQNFEPQSSRPEATNPFGSNSLNFSIKPQNFNSGLQIEVQKFEPQSFRPQTPNNFNTNLQNFQAKPQNFHSKPQNIQSKPQNFEPKPQNFPQQPQNTEPQIFRPQNNVDTSNFLQQSTNSLPPQFNRPIATSSTTPRRTTPPITTERTTQQPLISTNQLQVAPPQLQSNKPQNGRTECGLNNDFQPLVFAGAATRSGEYPWLVAMFYLSNRAYNFRCAGSLVSTRHVVTAAHCIRIIGRPDINREDVLIVMGKHNLKHWATQSTIKGVSEFLVHPDFKGPGDADVAVVLLDGEVNYSATVRPLCLWEDPDQLDDIVGSSGVVAGWGRDETGRDFVEEPAQIAIPIVSQETCLRSDDRFLKLTSRRTFCAGSRNGSIPCTGDSGGGFFLKRNGKWVLRGVVSVALVDPNTRSCDASHYVVFSDVPKYRPWLTKAMRVT